MISGADIEKAAMALAKRERWDWKQLSTGTRNQLRSTSRTILEAVGYESKKLYIAKNDGTVEPLEG